MFDLAQLRQTIERALRPFSPSELQVMREMQLMIPEARAALDKAQRAGLDTTDHDRQITDAEKKLAGILREYDTPAGNAAG